MNPNDLPAAPVGDVYVAFGTCLLAFVRIVLIFRQAPILGSGHMKNQVKIGLAALMALVAYPTLKIPENFPTEPRGYIICILGQICVGLAIGFVSYLVMAAAQFGGEMMDIQMGLSAAATVDPCTGGTSKLIMRLNFYFAMLLYLTTNGHHEFFRALYRSFDVIPVTTFHINGHIIQLFVDHTEDIFLIGLQIAAPPLAALFITQIAMGLLARVAPQMNVFMLSFPVNIGVGMMMLSVGLPVIHDLLLTQFDVNIQQTLDVIDMLNEPFDPNAPFDAKFAPAGTPSPWTPPPPPLPLVTPAPIPSASPIAP
jgi:flagellar biosynthetic protein FliR